jgi:hypothetical protein
MVIEPIEAERQFKIDFYEFYALLERGLVCLLGVWGIVITASAAPDATVNMAVTSQDRSNAIIGDSLAFHVSCPPLVAQRVTFILGSDGIVLQFVGAPVPH